MGLSDGLKEEYIGFTAALRREKPLLLDFSAAWI